MLCIAFDFLEYNIFSRYVSPDFRDTCKAVSNYELYIGNRLIERDNAQVPTVG